MSSVLQQYETAAVRRVDPASWRAYLLQPTAIGLLLALATLALLGGWFYAQAAGDAVARSQERIATVEAMALAQSVAAIAPSEEAAPGAVQVAVAEWAGKAGADRYIRVVRLGGSRLLASTNPLDQAEAAPRRLRREEKPLFDLGQELRAAIDTNASEGVARKAQVNLERVDGGRLRVTVPYRADGAMAGFVQIEQPLPNVGFTDSIPPRWWLVVLPLLAFFLAALPLRGAIANALRDRRVPWAAFALAAVLLVAVAWWFNGQVGKGIGAALVDGNTAVADATRRVLGAASATGASLDATLLDVDAFERPRGLLSADGAPNVAAATAAATAVLQPLGRSLWLNWVLAVGVLAFFALGAARRVRDTFTTYRYAYAYVTPAMVGMLILVFFPFAYGIALSFTGQTIFNTNQPLTDLWVGFANYIDIIGNVDVVRSTAEGWSINYQNFYWTLFITICWTVSNVLVGVTLGMILALALNTPGLKGKAIYRVLLILPWAIPNYITALIWKALFHQQFGAINQAIQMFGGEPVRWFDSVFAAFMTGLITNGWLSFPFMMVVILGGLASISQDMYEAATVEGATKWQQFKRITIPLLKPTLIPAIILSVVWTFNMFNVIYLVSGGEPAGANEILITKAYKIAFEEYRYAYSAAYSTVIFLILLVYGVFQTRMTRATEAVNQ
jgi:arabinogalactan oligomer/maltooligosaccharide transport system permease protein